VRRNNEMKKKEEMKKIAVSGGKGGVGKSTLTILLANKFIKEGKKVVLVDCDVECPNDYFLLGESLNRPIEKVWAEFPKLNKKKCRKCGLCARVCKNNAIFAPPGKYPVFVRDLCSGCGACWEICPHKAIGIKKEEIAKIYLNKIIRQDFYLVTGLARAGLEETGPVVIQTKKFALEFAEKIGADILLIDTAAGIHCPVVSALLRSDLVYAVTEPTPMGAYDLNLILNLCQRLELKTGVIINQADLGEQRDIQRVIKRFKIKIEMEVPYSKELVRLYSKGRLLNFNHI